MSEWTDRTRLLIGQQGIDLLKNARAAVLGLGGVGGNAAEALCRAGVSQELHIYSLGEHGLSLANAATEDTLPGKARVCPDCEGWVDMAVRWLKRQFGV